MPRNSLTCPYCWHSFKENELLFWCGEACPEKDRVSFTAQESTKGLCPHGRRPVPRRFCPHCKRALLREYLESDGRNVAVIGSADSGKTTYIGVLLHELRGRVSAQFNGMALDLLGDESRKNYEDRFKTPLFDRGEAVRSTARLRAGNELDPLIFTLKIPTASRWRSGVKSMLTVFYDASGENVMDAKAMDPLARYLETAGGILLLIDPMQMPRVREAFGAGLPPSAPNQKLLDQRAVVERLAELLRESAAKGDRRLDTPLAIAITKMDLLRAGFDDHSPLRRTSNHDGYYDEDDGADVHEEIRGWLEHWFGPDFDNTVGANFSDYRYFGLTALGAPPLNEKRLSPSGIHPYRVEDPMLWLLARFGSIRSLRRKR